MKDKDTKLLEEAYDQIDDQIKHRKENNFVSGGLNPNWQKTCVYPKCDYFIKQIDPRYDGGWCGHSKNKSKPSPGWPEGFTPYVSSTGGCDLHSAKQR